MSGSPGTLAVRQFRFWLTDYRRTWRGTIISSVLNPVLFLGAMGLGLGTLVNRHGTAHLGGVSYLTFLAPGLLAAAAMETGIGECTYPVLGSVNGTAPTRRRWLRRWGLSTCSAGTSCSWPCGS